MTVAVRPVCCDGCTKTVLLVLVLVMKMVV